MVVDTSLSYWAWSLIVALAVVFCLYAHRAKRAMDVRLIKERIKHLNELIEDLHGKELYREAARLAERKIDLQIELIRLTGEYHNAK